MSESPDLLTRILIVDDTAMYRKILSDTVTATGEGKVVASCPLGRLALERLDTMEVDLVLLDVFMPEMDGIQTLRLIREKHPNVCVVLVSGATTSDAEITLNGLDLGALDFIPKPQASSLAENIRIITEDVRRAIRLTRAKRLRSRPIAAPVVAPKTFSTFSPTSVSAPATVVAPAPVRSLASKTFIRPRSIGLIVIGVSTGGPNALNVFIPALSDKLNVPILLVQHMPPMFTKSLAEHLDKKSRLRVHEAVEGEAVLSNHIYIAPGGRHMAVARKPGTSDLVIALNDQPHVNSCRPAVDVLFQSVAREYPGSVLSIILTGMGEDGANGVATLKTKTCYSIAQDEASCVVYGMPRAVVDRNLADEVLPLDAIAARVEALVLRGSM